MVTPIPGADPTLPLTDVNERGSGRLQGFFRNGSREFEHFRLDSELQMPCAQRGKGQLPRGTGECVRHDLGPPSVVKRHAGTIVGSSRFRYSRLISITLLSLD